MFQVLIQLHKRPGSRAGERNISVMHKALPWAPTWPSKRQASQYINVSFPEHESFHETLTLTFTTPGRLLVKVSDSLKCFTKREKEKSTGQLHLVPQRIGSFCCCMITSNNIATLLERMDMISLTHICHQRECNNN